MTEYFLITKDELVKAMPERATPEQMKVLMDVLTRPYKEKSGLQVIGGGLASAGKGAVNVAGKIWDSIPTEEQKKGGKRS